MLEILIDEYFKVQSTLQKKAQHLQTVTDLTKFEEYNGGISDS